jgi:hypothetical protein
VTRVAAEPAGAQLVAGLGDGRIWVADVRTGRRAEVRPETGPPVSALALQRGQIAWGDEDGGAGVEALPAL